MMLKGHAVTTAIKSYSPRGTYYLMLFLCRAYGNSNGVYCIVLKTAARSCSEGVGYRLGYCVTTH